MNIFATISLFSWLFCLFVGSFVFFQSSKKQLHKVFMLLCLFNAYWGFTEFMYRQAGDPGIAFFWVKAQAFCPITVAAAVHFAMVFTGRSKVFQKRWPWVVLYGPPLIISIVSLFTDQIVIGVTKTYWGYTPVPAGSYFQNLIHTTYLSGMSVLSIIISFSYFLRVDDHKEKKRALHVALGCFVPFFLGFMTQAILPNLNIRTPELTAFGTALQELFLGYAIWKYDLFSLNPATAANNIVSTMSDLLILARPNGRIVMTNQAVTKALGFREEELIHTQLTTIMSGDAIRILSVEAEIHDGVQIGARFDRTTGIDHLEATLIARDGTKIPASVAVSILKEIDGSQAGYVVIARDITSQKQAEEALKKSEEKYRTILENIEDTYYEVDIAGNFTFFNDSLCKILGYSKDELMGVNNRQHTDKENDKMIYQAFNKVYRTGKPNTGTQYEIIRKDGTRRQVEASASLMKDADDKPIGFRGIIRDVTERKQAEDQIKASLKEKEVLLKEVHHRVKNNLQVIASLLSLQSQHITDKQSLAMFQESQNRVKSMSLIHETLYQSNDLSRIDMNEYTKDLTTSLFRSYADSAAAIKLKTKVDDLLLDITTAIPCGLIINELTSNALKHGFPDGRQGEITIAMHPVNSKIELVVSDTGVGFPEEIDFRNTTTLGMQLVDTLVEQLDGTIELDRRAGSAFTICFEELTYKKRI